MGHSGLHAKFGGSELLLSAPVPIAICLAGDDGHRVAHVNPAFTAMTGYALEECVGRTRGFLTGPDSNPATLEALHREIDQGRPVRHDLIIYRKDGTPFWVDMAVAPIRRPAPGVILTLT